MIFKSFSLTMKKFSLVFLCALLSITISIGQSNKKCTKSRTEMSAKTATPAKTAPQEDLDKTEKTVTLNEVEKQAFMGTASPNTIHLITPSKVSDVVLVNEPKKETVKVQIAVPSHADFDALLKKYVSATGKVNYKGLKTEKAALESYILTLSDNMPAKEWSKDDKLAYWINAYNALTIKLILDNYPLSKITDLDKGKTWDVRRFKLGDKTYSLNDIENTIVRPMNDPRIHFALNCAAKSCPALYNEAFEGAKLNAQLEKRTKNFINDPSANTLLGDEVKISKIFDWYGKDFGTPLLDFINRYALKKAKKEAKIGYKEYDWRLNE
jgi:hypothetical protein